MVDDDRLGAGEHRVGDDGADRHLVHDRRRRAPRASRTRSRASVGPDSASISDAKISELWPAARSTSRASSVCAPTAPGSSVGTNWWTITSAAPDDGLDRVEQLSAATWRCRTRAAGRAPAATNWACSAASVTTRCTAVAIVYASLASRRSPASPRVSGTAAAAYGDDRDAVVHRFEQRDAESLVLARDDVHVGSVEVRGQRARAHAPGHVDRVVEAERVDEAVSAVSYWCDDDPPTRCRRARCRRRGGGTRRTP